MIVSLLYYTTRHLLSIPGVLLRRETTWDAELLRPRSINECARLEPTRSCLRTVSSLAGSGEVLTLAVSDRFINEAVRRDGTTDPATFRPVPVTVKETTAVVWIGLLDRPYPSDPGVLTAAPPVERTGPPQLPAALRAFTGREPELAALSAAAAGPARAGEHLDHRWWRHGQEAITTLRFLRRHRRIVTTWGRPRQQTQVRTLSEPMTSTTISAGLSST